MNRSRNSSNRMIEVIKVIDFTDIFVRMKEILYVKVMKCTAADKVEVFQIAGNFQGESHRLRTGQRAGRIRTDSDQERCGGQTDERRIQEHRGCQRRKRGDRIDQYDGAIVPEQRCRGERQFRSGACRGERPVQERHSQSRTYVLTAAAAASLLIERRSADSCAQGQNHTSMVCALCTHES